ncbi:unnamed protein product [Lupinus luteus]|uniref:ABC transporter family G domain-containing protein n=1 Tax=Lupinus luteus TaxID=3873 RepID=A0AAV1VQU5_LUPLU
MATSGEGSAHGAATTTGNAEDTSFAGELWQDVKLGKQRLREARTQAVDFLILLLAGLCLGTLAKVSDESFGSTGYTYTVIAVCIKVETELFSWSLAKAEKRLLHETSLMKEE